MAELTASFEKATAAKLKCQQEAESTALTISLANRLVGGLAAEKIRWGESVKIMKEDEKTLGKKTKQFHHNCKARSKIIKHSV